MNSENKQRVLLYAINNTFHWWKNIGEYLAKDYEVKVITEHKTKVVDSLKGKFYFYLNKNNKTLFSEKELDEIYRRCRVLRSLNKSEASQMIISYEKVFEELFKSEKYDIIISFPIDRYPMDVLERVSRRYDVDYLELTAAVFENSSMLLKRGKLVNIPAEIERSFTESDSYSALVNKNYKPVYVQNINRYTRYKWIKTFIWQWARAIAFKVIMKLEKDQKSLHYLDSQMYLDHKVSLKDILINRFICRDYLAIMKKSPSEKNIIIALQLYPEASIDYWVESLEIVNYENFMIQLLNTLSESGFKIFLKDHPLQFGFRQIKFISEAVKIDNVHFLPYESDINEIFNYTSISFTTTGTIGLQAALHGKVSIVTPSYYSNPEDFIELKSEKDIKHLSSKIQEQMSKPLKLEERRKRLIGNLHNNSMNGNIFSFKQRHAFEENSSLTELKKNLRRTLKHKFQK